MADFKPIFEVDAGAILAKLHLAGQQQATGKWKDAKIINTAIKNPTNDPNPENPGKTTFDFENSSGEYQVGILAQLRYLPVVDLEKDKTYLELKNKYLEAKGEAKEEAAEKKEEDKEDKEDKDADSKDAHSKESLTAKTKDKDDATAKESISNKNKLMNLLFEDVDSLILEDGEDDKKEDGKKEDDKKEEEEPKELVKAREELLKHIKTKYLDKKGLFKGTVNIDEEHFDKTLLEFELLVDTENVDKLQAKEEYRQSFLADTGAMQTYFTTFAGKDNAKKINPKEVIIKDIDTDGSVFEEGIESFDKIKDFKIEADDISEAIAEAEQKYLDENKSFDKNNYYTRTIALIVGYKVDID